MWYRKEMKNMDCGQNVGSWLPAEQSGQVPSLSLPSLNCSMEIKAMSVTGLSCACNGSMALKPSWEPPCAFPVFADDCLTLFPPSG